jgi:hypothetical protein
MGRSYECILDVFFTSTFTVRFHGINFTAQCASVITKPGNRTINQLGSGMSSSKKTFNTASLSGLFKTMNKNTSDK